MASPSLEERLASVEAELQRLKQQLEEQRPSGSVPWWEQRFGAFANSPEYEEASRLGREYRESLRPQAEDQEG